jgi:hypothetical protein
MIFPMAGATPGDNAGVFVGAFVRTRGLEVKRTKKTTEKN